MRTLTIVIILCILPIVGGSDYDAGIEAYKRGHYEAALYDFERRARKGDRVAQFCLGFMYSNGRGVAVDPDKGKDWYEKAAERDYAPAQNNLAIVYFLRAENANNKFVGVENTSETTDEWSRIFKDEWLSNYNDAAHWFQKAAVQSNNHIAQYNIALTRYQWAVTSETLARQVNEILRLLDEDSADPSVQELVKTFKEPEFSNLLSDAVEAYEEAVNWFTKSAEQGYHKAQYQLGNRFYYNEGVDKNLSETERWEKAVYWYRKAKEHNTNAHYSLAKMYFEGKGVDKDLKKAKELYEEIATPRKNYKGYAPAQFKLGKLYNDGKSVEKDFEKATYWYTEAAEQDNVAAQNNLALIYNNLALKYAEGEGVPKNSEQARIYSEKATRLYFTAAQGGYPVAQVNVGLRFEKGTGGLPQDNSEAYYWYSLALRNPVKLDELTDRENMANTVTEWREGVGKLIEEKKSEIQARVDEWKPKILNSSGTGFYIDKKHILTNAHVARWEEKLPNGASKWHKYDELRIGYRYVAEKPSAIPVDTDADLALLFDEGESMYAATFRKNPVYRGEKIALFGYPLSFDLSYEGNTTSGNISGLLGPINSPLPTILTIFFSTPRHNKVVTVEVRFLTVTEMLLEFLSLEWILFFIKRME